MDFILVFIGGGLGSLLRNGLGQFFETKHIHYCTLGINVVACLLIGILSGIVLYKSNLNKMLSVLLITGFCGGFSTLSAYSLDIVNLFRAGHNFDNRKIFVFEDIQNGNIKFKGI